MKKLIALLVAVLMMAALTACDTKQSAEPQTTTPPGTTQPADPGSNGPSKPVEDGFFFTYGGGKAGSRCAL